MTESVDRAALEALEGCLRAFREGRIEEPETERKVFDRHLVELSRRWDGRFPGFPREYFPFTSFRGEWHRGRRDAYLKDIIVGMLGEARAGTIVNPACVFGRHARHLARRLPRLGVVGTDVDWRWNWWYERLGRGRTPPNFTFRQDDVFEPCLEVNPVAVVFFGACGSVTDGAIDYAIRSGARHLVCRTCCHDNIGGNTQVVRRRSHVSRFFRFKNRILERMRALDRYGGWYFSERYPADAYPRSRAARTHIGPEEMRAVARHSPESDVCRAIIDLDRHLYLLERGYQVWYQGELFVAERPLAHA